MREFIVSLNPRLSETGDCITMQGKLDEPSYTLGHDTYELEDGIDYQLTLQNSGGTIILNGTAQCTGKGVCSRCLEPASFDCDAELEGFYVHTDEEAEGLGLESDEYEIISSDETIDLSGAFLGALALETPLVLLCKPDCKGLCPHCGCNLNVETCDCAEKHLDEEATSNPFSVLKDMFPENGEDAAGDGGKKDD